MELTYNAPAYRRTATHIYLLPHPVLRGMVAHYTLCLTSPEGAEHGDLLTLVPDASGCLVFELSPGGLTGQLFGPSTRLTTVQNDLGLCPFRFFVECPPGGLYGLTGLPLWELADRVFPLSDTAPELERAVSDAFRAAESLPAFVRAVDSLLLARPRFENPAGPMLRALSAGESPAGLGWSPRHLSRLLRQGAGMDAKSFLRVTRVNQAVRRLSAGPVPLTFLAQELGYYDQSHFIHDFSSVMGLSPGAYAAHMADFYKEPLKL